MKMGFIGVNDLDGVKKDAQFAAANGYEGIEYNYWKNFEDLTEDTVKKMRAILDDNGVAACALGLWGWNHIARSDEEREESLGHLDRAIEYAQILGTEILITGAGEIPDASPEENTEEFCRIMLPYVEKADEAGLKIALYPVHGNSFIKGLEDYQRIWEQVPDVGIKLDPANIRHSGEDYLPILRDAGDQIYHMHVKEHLYMDGELVSQPAAGLGDIEWGKIMAFLYEHDYDGYLSVEPHGPKWSQPPLRRKCLLLTRRYIGQFMV
ncbi:MAG: sugar phosphate isomerase/epimerase [Planctomycetes bacterium]|nr:sugar phosphate isomerase/epimerase [Planctomycetota bacterium]